LQLRDEEAAPDPTVAYLPELRDAIGPFGLVG
jgi:hypothetical protein